jgi:hypothetical protein
MAVLETQKTVETGVLRILTERGGTVAEITQFLGDLESAYLALYDMDRAWSPERTRRHMAFMALPLFNQPGFPNNVLSEPRSGALTADTVLPEDRLVVRSVRIESPGFWEVIASFNPLLQIREYLNDRHKRRQDREFREAAERDRLLLENELIQRQVWEKDNSILRERIEFLKKLGLADHDIRQLIWAQLGKPLSDLGKHQDSGLIGGAE